MYYYKKGKEVTACIENFDELLNQGYERATEADFENSMGEEAKAEIEAEAAVNAQWEIVKKS